MKLADGFARLGKLQKKSLGKTGIIYKNLTIENWKRENCRLKNVSAIKSCIDATQTSKQTADLHMQT
jgi:hypothetical protein